MTGTLFMDVEGLRHDEDLRSAVARAIESEVEKRAGWDSLDNWTYEEVAGFALEAAADHICATEVAA